ncbi:hypothetical protein ACFMBG_14825 [Leisingera sp. D0M16]|uniref:hypothetical protein n=1 Tax=Leisingera coralii TaxID=3351347 RepID=UPI003B7D42E1
MNEFRVTVHGAGPPRGPDGPLRRALRRIGRMLRALLLRPRIVIASMFAAFVLMIGTPHAGWDYECRHPMRGPGSCRSVAWCAYYGIQGRRVEFPEYGERCKLITVLPVRWDKLL